MMKRKLFLYIMIGTLFLTGCGGQVMDKEPAPLVVYSPHPRSFVQPLVDEFERQTGIAVMVVQGSTGDLLQRLANEEPCRADVLWGGAISTVAEKRELFVPYTSPQEDMLQPQFRNQEGFMTRFTNVPSVLLVNTNLVGDMEIRGYGDLLNPQLRGKIAFADPAGSSSAYEHLLNILYVMGREDKRQGWQYVEALCQNIDGKLLTNSAAVYEGVAQGRFVVGCTFEEAAMQEVAGGAPVKIVYMLDGVLSEPDGVYIVKHTNNLAAAQAFVEFVISRETQNYIARHLHRRSVRQDVPAIDDRGIILNAPQLDSVSLTYESREEVVAKFQRYYELSEGGN